MDSGFARYGSWNSQSSRPLLHENLSLTSWLAQGILGLISSVLFLVVAITRVYFLASRTKVARSGWLLFAKLVLYAALVLLQIFMVAAWSLTDAKPALAIAVSALGIIDGCVLSALSYLEHQRSSGPSLLIGAYLWCAIVLDLAQARSLLLLGHVWPGVRPISSLFGSIKAVQVLLLVLEEIPKRKLLRPRAKEWPAESTSGPFSRCMFWWLRHVFLQGYRGSLRIDNLGAIDDQFSSRTLLDKLTAAAIHCTDPNTGRHFLLGRIWAAFKLPLLWPFIPRLLMSAFSFAQPLLIKQLISFLSDPVTKYTGLTGWELVVATGFVYLGIAVFSALYAHMVNRVYTILRGGLVAAMLNKALKLNAVHSSEGAAAAVTLMSTDVEGLFPGVQDLYELLANSIELILAMFLLQREIGAACFLVAVPAVVCTFLSSYVSEGIGPARMEWAEATQARVSTISLFLSQVKSLKMTGLADYVSRKLRHLRVCEGNESKKFRTYIVWILGVANMSHHLTPAVVILAAVFWTRSGGEGFSISQAFTSLSIVALISKPIAELTAAYPTMTASLACLERIGNYLASEEQRDGRVASGHCNGHDSHDRHFSQPGDGTLVALRKVTVTLPGKAGPVLRDLEFDMNESTITMITGPVGCGKSLLLQTILGEIPTTSGAVFVNCADASIAYCDQAPWLRNRSIRDNIVAGEQYEPVWYEKVVRACALEQDIARLRGGDSTAVGSGGAKLSGGQKQRVALARAIYSKRSIIVLDDVFSSLDAATAARISQTLLGHDGLVRSMGTTVLLATHSNLILVLDKTGEIKQRGSYAELCARDGYFKSLDVNTTTSSSEPPGEEDLVASPVGSDVSELSGQDDTSPHDTTADWKLYRFYLSSVEPWYIIVFVLLGIGFIWVGKLPLVWLRVWTEHGTTSDNALYSSVYMALCIMAIILSAAVFWWYGLFVIPRSGLHIHQLLLDSYLNAPLWFLTQADSGSLLNRFGQDMSLVDQQMPMACFETVLNTADTVAAAAIIASGAPYLSGIIAASLIIIYVLQQFYLKTSKALRHLDLDCKAPLYTFLTEARSGLVTIRSYGWQDAFVEEGLQLLDTSQKPYYLMLCAQEWLSLAMGIFVTGISVLLVAFATRYPNTSGGGAIGLAMVGLMSFNGSLYGIVTAWTKMETSLGAAARVQAFVRDTPSETLPDESAQSPPDSWPSRGSIEVSEVDARYKQRGDEILRHISLRAQPGQKIGICGATGSGKSSLLLTVLRLLETTSRSVCIDGIDLSTISRQGIRSQLTVLPQDPVELPETVRDSLDFSRLLGTHDDRSPAGEYHDQALHAVLKRTGVWESIREAGGLDADFRSVNLSHGQSAIRPSPDPAEQEKGDPPRRSYEQRG